MARRDVYQEITDKIVAVLDRINPDEFEAPFAALAAQGMPFNPTTDHHYQGINIPSLWVDQQQRGFASSRWATFKQWHAIGAQVRKGEKGSPIVFYKTLTKEEENERGEAEEISIPMLRSYTVFNADQVDGYEHCESAKASETDLVTRIEAADVFCQNTGADIHHGGGRAYYRRDEDFIAIPETTAFMATKAASATENYYAVLFHELTHWSGAPHRLNRDKAASRRELQKYAFEELIAELGAAFLCSKLGIVQTPRDDHAAYIKNWLQALKGDKKFIFKASAQAAKAAEYLGNLRG